MNTLILPLVESLIEDYQKIDFSKVRIIGAQHILETTHAMFRSLYRLGLDPKNISLIGKCYSTNQEVYNEMLADGINVSYASFSYNSYQSYDELYNQEVENFLNSLLDDLTTHNYDRIIILDDGGKCIKFINAHKKIDSSIVAIEQTSAGYHAIKELSLTFPVINVARSPLKLIYESPMIAEAAAERLYLSLRNRNIFPSRALILGGGAIGLAMKEYLKNEMDIYIYDENPKLSDFICELEAIIDKFPLIIGCTGKTSIRKSLHNKIAPGTVLVSASSSDREFDAVQFRKLLPLINDCHQDLFVEDKLLVRSGFPVNFDGERENIDPEKIQLTIALITAGILQSQFINVESPLIFPIQRHLEEKIKDDFISQNINKEYKVVCVR